MANSNSDNDVPLHSALLIFAAIVGLAFTVFQIRSCASTPEYVQALEACNESVKVPFKVQPKDSSNTENWTVDIQASPETFALLKHCYDTVARRFGNDPPVLDIPKLPL